MRDGDRYTFWNKLVIAEKKAPLREGEILFGEVAFPEEVLIVFRARIH